LADFTRESQLAQYENVRHARLANTDWYYTPTTASADLTGPSGLGAVPVSTNASSTTRSDGTKTTTVVLKNTSTGKVPAFYADTHVVDPTGAPVLPVRWNDNAVSLWPGETTTLVARYRTADLKGSAPSVRVSGWNTGTRTVPASGGGSTAVAFPGTGGWATWTTATARLNLVAGTNKVKAVATTANGGPNVDKVTLQPRTTGAGRRPPSSVHSGRIVRRPSVVDGIGQPGASQATLMTTLPEV
jgi:hypothetical protein